MQMLGVLALLAASLGQCDSSDGTQPRDRWWPWLWGHMPRPCQCCPDDYDAKKLPPAPCAVCSHHPDDYDAKPLPKVCPLKWSGVDDYDRKPLPPWPQACYPPWYRCGDNAKR